MIRNALLLAFFVFTPHYAFGDFVPGRVRAAAEAEMAAKQGTGRYEQVRAANSVLFKADGKGYVKFTLRLDGRPEIPFAMTEIRSQRCSKLFVAVFQFEGQRSRLEVTESNTAGCRGDGDTIWNTRLITEEGPNTPPSQLVLAGNAEYFMLTE